MIAVLATGAPPHVGMPTVTVLAVASTDRTRVLADEYAVFSTLACVMYGAADWLGSVWYTCTDQNPRGLPDRLFTVGGMVPLAGRGCPCAQAAGKVTVYVPSPVSCVALVPSVLLICAYTASSGTLADPPACTTTDRNRYPTNVLG